MFAYGYRGTWHLSTQALIATTTNGGRDWTATTFPGDFGQFELLDAWGTNGVAYAVGRGGPILQYARGQWTPADSWPGTTAAVWGTSPTDVYAYGDNGAVLHGTR